MHPYTQTDLRKFSFQWEVSKTRLRGSNVCNIHWKNQVKTKQKKCGTSVNGCKCRPGTHLQYQPINVPSPGKLGGKVRLPTATPTAKTVRGKCTLFSWNGSMAHGTRHLTQTWIPDLSKLRSSIRFCQFDKMLIKMLDFFELMVSSLQSLTLRMALFTLP